MQLEQKSKSFLGIPMQAWILCKVLIVHFLMMTNVHMRVWLLNLNRYGKSYYHNDKVETSLILEGWLLRYEWRNWMAHPYLNNDILWIFLYYKFSTLFRYLELIFISHIQHGLVKIRNKEDSRGVIGSYWILYSKHTVCYIRYVIRRTVYYSWYG